MGFYNVHNFRDHHTVIPVCFKATPATDSPGAGPLYLHGLSPHSVKFGNKSAHHGRSSRDLLNRRKSIPRALSSAPYLPVGKCPTKPQCAQAAPPSDSSPLRGLVSRRQTECCASATVHLRPSITDWISGIRRTSHRAARIATVERTIRSQKKRYQKRCLHPMLQKPAPVADPVVEAKAPATAITTAPVQAAGPTAALLSPPNPRSAKNS
jgi:hypothetical protein